MKYVVPVTVSLLVVFGASMACGESRKEKKVFLSHSGGSSSQVPIKLRKDSAEAPTEEATLQEESLADDRRARLDPQTFVRTDTPEQRRFSRVLVSRSGGSGTVNPIHQEP